MITARDLSKTEGVLTAGPEDSLASALSKMHSSHDAVFVTQKNELLGVISPYHVLYRTSFPPATKLKNCLFLAPKLQPETRADEIARLMLEAKIYFLPLVTATGKWLGVVSYRRLLHRQNQLDLKLKTKALVTIKETATVGQARNLMKTSGVSRLVVVADSGRLSGILTRYDLGGALGRPQHKINYLGRVGEKAKASNAPIRPYIKRNVITIGLDQTVAEAVNLMLDHKIGSVVIINKSWQPVGLLSVRDCLEAIARTEAAPPTPIQIRINKVRSGFEAFARSGNLIASAVSKFKRQAIHDSLKKLKARLRKN